MSLDEIVNEHLKVINSSWDYHIDDRHGMDDISIEKVLKMIEKIERQQNKSFDDDPVAILRKYELIKDDKLTYGAYLLFVDNNSALTSFQIGRFKGETDIIDNIDINTDLLNQIGLAMEFIRKHLMVRYHFTGAAQREESYDYPLKAIREIVANMVVHRDYRDSGNSIIKIFDNKIEFYNPGKLMEGLTVEKLIKGEYISRSRNRAIARIFKECGIIERYGSGITRIIRECINNGIKEPAFEEFANGFKVTLYKKMADEGVNEGVSELYNLIRQNPGTRTPFFAKKMNTPAKTIERWLKELKKNKKIEFKGAPKSGGYFTA